MKKKRRARAKYFVEETISKPVTKKEFFKIQKQETEKDYIQRTSLLERKIFTKSQIDMLISAKVLLPSKYKNKIYFKKEEVAVGIKYLSEPPHLF